MAEVEAAPIHYQIDAGRSRFQVQVFAGGLLSAFGHNPTIAIRGISGEVWTAPDQIESSSLRLVIEAASLDVIGNINAKDRADITHRMREEVLEITRYPEIGFESTQVAAQKISEGHYQVRIDGNLSLRGVTRGQSIPARLIVTEDSLRASGEFRLKQTDYGIRPVSAVGGTLKVKDELQFTFELVADRL